MTSPRTIRAAESLAQECIRAQALGIASQYGCATSHEYGAWLCTVRRISESVSRRAASVLRPLRHRELCAADVSGRVACIDSVWHMGWNNACMDAPSLIPAGSVSDAFGGQSFTSREGF